VCVRARAKQNKKETRDVKLVFLFLFFYSFLMDSKRCALRKLRGAFVNACKCVPHFAPNISIDICNFFFLICERKDVTFLLTLLPPFCSKNPPSTRELRRIATRKKREETDRLRKWRLFDSSAELWRVWWRFRGEFCAFKNDYLGRPFDFPFFFQRERFLQLFCCVPFGLPEGDFPV
jgi:hypothetical protein